MRKILKNYIDDLEDILDCIKVGVYITDGKGNTLILNDESCKTGGLTKNQVLGKNMEELTNMGFVKESASLKAIKTGQEESFIQDLGDGNQIFITGTPFYKNGNIEFVVCTERDITEMLELKDLLKENEAKTKKYETEIEYLRNRNLEMLGSMIAEDPKMQTVIEKSLRVAKYDTTILLTGESGTGKEVLANLIYKNSNRVGKPFIKVNCAAIPENLLESEFFGYEKGSFTGADKEGKIGIFELANSGTVFLDEIGDLPIHVQSKLLRAIQEREIMRVGGHDAIALDIRIIAATNKNLKKAIAKGEFREDLFYRLNIMPIEILPLRERKKDIEKLTNYFIGKYSKEYKLSKVLTNAALTSLINYQWPGNVRELENVIERILVSYDGMEITKFQVENMLFSAEHLFEPFPAENAENFNMIMDYYEKTLLEKLLKNYKTANELSQKMQINKSTLSRKLKKYNLNQRMNNNDFQK